MRPVNAPGKIFLLRGMRGKESFSFARHAGKGSFLLHGISVFLLHGTLPENFFIPKFLYWGFNIIHNILYNLIYRMSTK